MGSKKRFGGHIANQVTGAKMSSARHQCLIINRSLPRKDTHQEVAAINYTVQALGFTRAATGPEASIEVAFSSYFLAHGCMAGKTIVDASEETLIEIVVHLSGLTTCLMKINNLRSSFMDYEALIAMKCAWYNIYVVFIRSLKRGYPRERGYEDLADLSIPLQKLSELIEIWWELEIGDSNISPWLQELYRLSKLKLALYELQRALDHWYLMTEENMPDQKFIDYTDSVITRNLNRVRFVCTFTIRSSLTNVCCQRDCHRVPDLYRNVATCSCSLQQPSPRVPYNGTAMDRSAGPDGGR